jgi:ABC-type nitrate/sulfonate/bicarbonate transport system substrate-binding protein
MKWHPMVWTAQICAVLFVAVSGAVPSLAQNAPVAIEVTLGDVSMNKVPALVAADENIYAKHGLVVHQYITPGAADKARRQGVDVPQAYVKANAADDAQIAMGGGTPMIVRSVRVVGATERVIIATFEDRIRNHIVSSTDIGSPAELKGKRLGFNSDGSVTHLAALSFVKLMGWDPHNDISLYLRGNTPNAILSGQIDAFVGSILVRSLADQAGLKDLLDLSQFDIPVAGSGLNVERAWLADNRETAKRYTMSIIEAVALMKADRDVFARATAKWFNITDPEVVDMMHEEVEGIVEKPYPTVDGIRNTMAVYNFHEMQQRQVDDFYDASIVTELDESGFIDDLYR